MSNLAFVVLLLSALGWTQMTPGCASTPTDFTPACTLTYTPYMTPECGPTSTVYGTIVTTYFNVVDCQYCTVTNVDANPAPDGPFTTKTTSPTLTVTRVNCISDATAVTRRDLFGFDDIDHQPRSIALEENNNILSHTKLRRSVKEIVQKISKIIDPVNNQLTVKAYNLVEQLNSAVFAINLISSGFNLTSLCQEIRDPSIQIELSQASLDGQQIGDIICFVAVYGIDLNSSSAAVLQDLEAAIYAIEAGSEFPSDNTRLCNILNLSFGSYLGVDVDAVYQFICGSNYTSTTTISSTTTENITVVTNTATLPAGQSGTIGTIISGGTVSSGGLGGYANSTPTADTESSGGVEPSITSSPLTATGSSEVGSDTNVTTSTGTAEDTAISGSVGTESANITSTNGQLPPNPTASPYYAVWLTSTTAPSAFNVY